MNERTRHQITNVAGFAGLSMFLLLAFYAFASHQSGGNLYVNNDEFKASCSR